jgi:DNA mismatch repair protein MutS2
MVAYSAYSKDNFTRALDWDRLILLAQNETLTTPGRALITALTHSENWAADLTQARLMQQETQEITPLLDREALWGPLVDLGDPEEVFERLTRGGVLEIHDWVMIRSWLFAIDSWAQIPREEIKGERIKKALSELPNPLSIIKVVSRILTPAGELSEKSSAPLELLSTEIRSLKREIGKVLDLLIKTYSQKGILQDTISDLRDGRYVLPIKIGLQGEVEGVIYESSASHQTVYIEPKAVAKLNDLLRQKQNAWIQEAFIVLEETSKYVRPYTGEIARAVAIISHWDSIQSKARLGRRYSGKPIRVTEERHFHLQQTAHPLLWWSLKTESTTESIIRNDIQFGSPCCSLLLSGPNTGGKTVLLKTLGLAGICARTGFPFPASELPSVPFFDAIFADLGDPQSIEQHLSSFSGHVMRFKEILEGMSDRSLVIIDELNSATDPEEGAAFGRAVLETIMSKNGMVVTTTHDPHLKALANKDARIMNISMAFDDISKSPTYRIIPGMPGRSRALETAERLGIDTSIIELAKKYLSREHLEFERLLQKLETDVHETTQAKREALAARAEASALKDEWTKRSAEATQEMMRRAQQKLQRILEQAQDEVRALVKKLDQSSNRSPIKAFDQARSALDLALRNSLQQTTQQMDQALREEAPALAEALALHNNPGQPQTTPPTSQPIQPGDRVRVPKWKTTGTVLEVSGNKIKVALGTLQMTLSTEEVALTEGKTDRNASHAFRLEAPQQNQSDFAPQIDLRGERYEEAMSHLEHYLDLIFRSGSYLEITVVHGLGTGALREGTLQLLKKLPYIKAFRNAGQNQGGAGATIVEFDRD